MKPLKNLFYCLSLLATMLLVVSCDDDDPDPENPEELITTVNITLTPTGTGGTVVTWSFVDLDGEGGNAPTITAPALAAGTTYNAAIELLNESETPAEDITAEVSGEALDHQFFFTGTAITNQLVSLTYDDEDSESNPIGLKFILTTGQTGGTGTLTVTLRHEPDKNATGVSSGDITNAGGETDIEVDFDVVVQ